MNTDKLKGANESELVQNVIDVFDRYKQVARDLDDLLKEVERRARKAGYDGPERDIDVYGAISHHANQLMPVFLTLAMVVGLEECRSEDDSEE